jgi:hypothetical protein
MAIFHSNLKVRAAQILSMIAFGAVLPNKYFPDSNYSKAIKPFNLYIVIIFFIAQGFMLYYLVQEKKAKKVNSN